MESVTSALQNLKQHPFTSIQLTDKEKFHTGMLKLLIEHAASIKLERDLGLIYKHSNGKPTCELELNSVDLLVKQNSTTTIVESKFKTGLHLSSYKGEKDSQITKYAMQHSEAQYGVVVSLFKEKSDLSIKKHKHISEFKNITYSKEVLQFLNDTLEQSKEKNDHYFLLKLWGKYLSHLKALVEEFEKKVLDSINNTTNLQIGLQQIKLKGVFQQFRMSLVATEVSRKSEYKGILGNTHGNALLHYEFKFSKKSHNLEKYGIQWQNGKIKFYIELEKKPKESNEDLRDKALGIIGSDLFDKFFKPLGYESAKSSNRSGKFKSRNIADIDEFGDLNNVAGVLVECLNYLAKDSLEQKILDLVNE